MSFSLTYIIVLDGTCHVC